MKALEFQGSLRSDATLKVPEQVARQLTANQPLRVILLVLEDGEELDWERLTAAEFAQGYSPSDEIYDDLPAR